MAKTPAKRGRPSQYCVDVQATAENYITDYHTVGDAIPSIAGLAHHLGVHRDTLYQWAKKSPEFADTLERIKTNQERVLINGGLAGEFNATLTKLMLANHGYSEKQEQTIKADWQPPVTKIELITTEDVKEVLYSASQKI